MPITTASRRRKAGQREPGLHGSEWTRQLRLRLGRWFDRNARDLPWRRTRDPYAVWVSEIMLQQTQVATVIDYFPRFLAALPTLESLAAAHEQRVLRLWEGLGYYRRARQMHRAAQEIVRRHAGQFPTDLADVLALPGVGRYTAGAVLSIAFDQRQPILEANTLRLISRLLVLREAPRSTAGQAALWSAAEAWLPRRQVGRFNQALMELGATVCTPREPRCPDCPLLTLCPTQRLGLQDQIPLPAKRPPITHVDQAAVVVRRRGRILLVLRGPGQRWAGMWDFPRFDLSCGTQAEVRRALRHGVLEQTGVECLPGELLTRIVHGVTRFRITLHVYQADAPNKAPRSEKLAMETQWALPRQLKSLGLNVTARKIATLLA